jgi:molybdopterin-containing oxidoreductase family membrane subunit
MELFPGKEILAGYGGIAAYTPTLPELMLGLGGMAVALIVITYLIKFLPFLPESLADDVADPHHKS